MATRRGGRAIRRLALFAALPWLAACAGFPPVPPEPPLSYPPAARERMLRIALAEWEEWGRRERIAGAAFSGNAVGAATPDTAHAAAARGGTQGATSSDVPGAAPAEAPPEADPANFPRVLAYWRALDDDGGAIARNRPLYAAALSARPNDGGRDAALWREPAWSAAFVSFVLRGAGVDRREFPPDAAHGGYIDALIRDAERFPDLAPFVPHAPGAYAPRPGDLACADRGPDPIIDWRQRAADRGRFRPMHCDIVVEGRPGFVLTVGGNLGDAVVRTRFPADASGYLLPPPPGGPAWFAVFENRLGRLPPWGERSAAAAAASHPSLGSPRP